MSKERLVPNKVAHCVCWAMQHSARIGPWYAGHWLGFRPCPESECAQQMRHALWSYSGFPCLRTDTQESSVHRLRCRPDRNRVSLHDRQSPLDRYQLMRDPKEEHPEKITQRPCGLREANTMTRDTVTLAPRCPGSAQAGLCLQHRGDA